MQKNNFCSFIRSPSLLERYEDVTCYTPTPIPIAFTFTDKRDPSITTTINVCQADSAANALLVFQNDCKLKKKSANYTPPPTCPMPQPLKSEDGATTYYKCSGKC